MNTLPLRLEPEDLRTQIEQGNTDSSLLIIDICSAENYAKHHLPGAVHIAPSELVCGIKPATGKLPSLEKLTSLFQSIGLTADKHVVVYDDEGGGWAGRFIWTLDVIGHTNYSYLDGGLIAWLNAGYLTESKPNTTSPSTIAITIDDQVIAEIDDVLAQLDDEQSIIWDARSSEEFRGEKVLAQRGGHIPGAVNLNWLDLMDRQNDLRLWPNDKLTEMLKELGITPDKQVITHCQTHHRSGLSYLVMKILGFKNPKAYHGSWSEWGNHSDTPIDTGT